jgi:DNA uptake protein ComE-like DNA-binding protein
MLRRNVFGIVTAALLSAATLVAQIKEMPRTPIKPVNESKVVDINTGTESDFVNLGIDRSVAKKIVDGRPYRTKRDLVTRQVLTKDQYDKFKASLIARRPSIAKKG